MAKELHSGKAGTPAGQASPPRKPATRTRAKEEAPPQPPRRGIKARPRAARLPKVTPPPVRPPTPPGAHGVGRGAAVGGPA
ncbi:MAG: hypothetical protein ABF600_11930, partial [Acetobacter fabarum]